MVFEYQSHVDEPNLDDFRNVSMKDVYHVSPIETEGFPTNPVLVAILSSQEFVLASHLDLSGRTKSHRAGWRG